MRSAFGSTRSAAAFGLLLLAVLLSPVLAGKNLLPPREQAYASLDWKNGPWPYLRHQIFEETGDIDIAIIGSSRILHCLDARRLQDELARKTGRPAAVRVLGWGGGGFDAVYFIARDLMARRHVRMLVVYGDHNDSNRNKSSPVWFRFAEDSETLAGLPLRDQAQYYFAALVGLPRNLLCRLRPNLPADLTVRNFWEEHYRSASLAAMLGSTTSELGFANADADPSVPFVPFQPASGATAADTVVYSPATASDFSFSSEPLPAYEIHFTRLLAALAARNDCRLALLHVPALGEARSQRLAEPAFWPDLLGANLVMLGVPPAKMFGGLADGEVRKLYFNPGHFNKNGQAYFTSLVTPALISFYETTGKH
jgi:hypothetical protein